MGLSVWPAPGGQVIKDQSYLPSVKIRCALFTAINNNYGKTKIPND